MLKRLALLLLLLTLPHIAEAAPAVVQLAKSASTFGSTSGTTAAFAAPTTTGNAVIVFARMSTATLSTATYSVGPQTCTAVTSSISADPHLYARICENITGGSSATCSVMTSGGDAYAYVACVEVSGVPTSSV